MTSSISGGRNNSANNSNSVHTEDALAQALKTCRSGFLAVVLFSFFINLLMLTVPLYMLQIFTRVLTSRSTDTLLLLFLVAVFALLVLAFLDSTRSFVMIRISTWMDRRVSGSVLESSFAASLTNRSNSPSVQGLRDLATVRGFMSGPSIFPMLDAPWTPLFIAVMFLLHPIIGWISVIGGLVIFCFAVANELMTRQMLMKSGGTSIRALQQADATVRNADVIEAMGMLRNIVKRWHRSNADALDLQARASARGAIIASSSKFLRFVLQLAVLSAGAWLVLQNEMNPGAMIAGSILMSRALQPIDQAISSWKVGVSARDAYRRLKTLLHERPPKPPSMPLPTPTGHISSESVTYAYGYLGEVVIRGVSFQLQPGEAMGIVGPTAAGKTTLARLLIGNLVPRSGHVRLDGMEISEWDSADRGQHIGYLPQDVELFDGTVSENIARMGEPDPGAVVEAARLAGVHEMIVRMPQGYDTQIGPYGAVLSGGQRQRIAFARAVYGTPRFLVLDEPNASLDTDGEHALVAALTALKERGATVITIAHRPSVLRAVDKILLLQAGQMAAFGPRDEVLAQVASAGHQLAAKKKQQLAEQLRKEGRS